MSGSSVIGCDIPDSELQWSAIRAQGAGGQNVNKVSSALHLRFDIRQSSLSDEKKALLLAFADSRISQDGVVIIKAQRYRTQELNRMDALQRLQALIVEATTTQKTRKATRPTRASKVRHQQAKQRRAQVKAGRGSVRLD